MSDSSRLAIVLVRTHLSSNLGSIARVAKNFGVRDLRLVEPAAAADEEAVRLASGADDALERVRRFPSLAAAVGELGAVVATTSLRGRGASGPWTFAICPGSSKRSAARVGSASCSVRREAG